MCYSLDIGLRLLEEGGQWFCDNISSYVNDLKKEHGIVSYYFHAKYNKKNFSNLVKDWRDAAALIFIIFFVAE